MRLNIDKIDRPDKYVFVDSIGSKVIQSYSKFTMGPIRLANFSILNNFPNFFPTRPSSIISNRSFPIV
jgi:hypothetical protein